MSSSVDFSQRQTSEQVDAQFMQRWSPRAYVKQPIPAPHLRAMIEAARWAPSCFNAQPWRFYTASTDQAFAEYLQVLVEANQGWAKNASVLGFVVTQQHFSHNGKANGWADFDAGAAWMSLALQASNLGYYAHGMGGFDADKAQALLQLERTQYRVIAAFAIGVLADLATLPADQQAKEKPNQRLSLAEIWPGQSSTAAPAELVQR
jgi:nitroreductase